LRSSLLRPGGRQHPLRLADGIGTTGSPVPYQRLRRAHATFTPGTTRTTRRPPPGRQRPTTAIAYVPGKGFAPGFDATVSVSMRQPWFTHVRLLVAHLTRSWRAFSATLTTPALDRRSLRWFGLPACTANPEELPPSLIQPGSCWTSKPPFRTHNPLCNTANDPQPGEEKGPLRGRRKTGLQALLAATVANFKRLVVHDAFANAPTIAASDRRGVSDFGFCAATPK
jgi:hypothetical protein